MISGAAASIASTTVLGFRGLRECDSMSAPINVISRWIWGDRAAVEDDPSLAHTAVGYGIHHASSVLWATVYEKFLGEHASPRKLVPSLAGGLAVAGLACFVDYKCTPYRLEPGFEKRISLPSMAGVYAAFGLTLAACGMLRQTADDSRDA
jgi:hypothetical protein